MVLFSKSQSTSLEAQAEDRFFSSIPTRLGSFLSINLVGFSFCLSFVSRVFLSIYLSFDIFPQLSPRVKKFFIKQSIGFLPQFLTRLEDFSLT